MPETIAKAWAALITVLLALHNATPHEIRALVPILVVFVGMDTLTGLWLAASKSMITSRKLSDKLTAKLLQYAIINVIGGAASIISFTWTPWKAALSACIAIESISMIENLTLLERHGGAHLGPVRPLLKNVSKYFDFSPPVGPEHPPEVIIPAQVLEVQVKGPADRIGEEKHRG